MQRGRSAGGREVQHPSMRVYLKMMPHSFPINVCPHIRHKLLPRCVKLFWCGNFQRARRCPIFSELVFSQPEDLTVLRTVQAISVTGWPAKWTKWTKANFYLISHLRDKGRPPWNGVQDPVGCKPFFTGLTIHWKQSTGFLKTSTHFRLYKRAESVKGWFKSPKKWHCLIN